jgi:hypothetical protein
VLAYVYLLRIPILISAILISFPILGLWTDLAKPLLQNFFVLGWWSTLLASLATMLVTWSVVLTSLVILFNGSDRFNVLQSLTQDTLKRHGPRTRLWIVIAMVGIALPLLLGQFLEADWPPPWRNLTAVALGTLGSYVLAYVAVLIVLAVAPPAIAVSTEIFPGPAFLRRQLVRVHQWSTRYHVRHWSWVRSFFLKWPRDLRKGLIDDREQIEGKKNAAYGLPWSGVVLAFAFALVTIAVYYWIGISNANDPTNTIIPALCFVLLLLLSANWVLSVTAFILDRFRIPLLAPLFIAAVLGEWITDFSEHFYRLRETTNAERLTKISPAAALRQRVQDGKPIIIVTTMGGGIQSASWTVQVLTGLQTEFQKQQRNVADSIALISAVSGGAHGTLFFLDQYRQNGADPSRGGFAPNERACAQFTDGQCVEYSTLRNRVAAPRLDGVAWALTYRDFPRILFPYFPGSYAFFFPFAGPEDGRFLDRGRVLEKSWENDGITGRLSTWQHGVTRGWRPAVIFNATVAETGEPFLFSTTDLRCTENCGPTGLQRERAQAWWRSPEPLTFRGVYHDLDIDLVTAARVASGFPYALPIPRASTEAAAASGGDTDRRFKYHLFDGGYYDNYGVGSAVQWLDQALIELEQTGSLPDKVLFIQIRSFPDVRHPDLNEQPKSADIRYEAALPRNRGWLFELYSPIAGLLRVRSSGQLLHNRDELALFRDKWRRNGKRVDIRFATFEFDRQSAPLSFKMNESQKKDIKAEWDQFLTSPDTPEKRSPFDEFKQVGCFFDDSSYSDCEQIRSMNPW